MSDMQAMNQRISDLEVHLSHQESAIQELSDITAKQWDVIDGLVRKFDLMRERLLTLEGNVGGDNLGDPLPPHF